MKQWLKDAYKKLDAMPEEVKQVREVMLDDLYFFAKVVNPGYMYGSVHKEIYAWLQEYDLYGMGEAITSNKLIMLPRAHLKSHMVATWCAWMIARHPEISIFYVSATADLAITQLYDIRNMLEGEKFQKYFPEYINPEVGSRDKWSATKINIDHPKRRKEGIRDATIATAGITTNTTGWHADVVVGDDLVVPDNAYTEGGRDSVSKAVSQFTSIRNAGGFTLACGTRYHPADIYGQWKHTVYEDYDSKGEFLGKLPVWEIREFVVENEGTFVWPRVVREDGKFFGFDIRVLARIKAEYSDRVQFHAQYYNDPNDPSSDRIGRDKFQYYNPRFLKREGGNWFYNGKRLNVYAAVDFAYSLTKRADYTAIVVIGVDSDKNIFVLDIERFKSTKIIDYFNKVAALHSQWSFKKIQAEVTAAQQVIVEGIKDHVKKEGLRLSVAEYRPNRYEGNKEERIAAVLEPKYDNMQVWHSEGGWTKVLEEELVLARPQHDDIKDALASAVSIAVSPARSKSSMVADFFTKNNGNRSRFGGVY